MMRPPTEAALQARQRLAKIIQNLLAQLIWVALASMGEFDNFLDNYFID